MIRKAFFVAVLVMTAFCLPSLPQSPPAKDTTAAPQSQDAKSSTAQTSSTDALETRVEKYLRNLYDWDKDYDVKVSEPKQSPIADLWEVPITVAKDGQSDSASIYVSKSGKYMLRGELTDMTVDPFAEVAAKLHVGNSPTLGPADAKVTLIEFADFECPACRQLDVILRDLLPKHPETRLVFKHFPLTDIHPWAMTAALATQCAYVQNQAAFWKMHDAIYDAQDTINPDNAWDKLLELATQAGVNPETYKACVANPNTANEIKATIEEGHTLKITATPTTFVNSRTVVGPNEPLLVHFILHNIAY